ncbi:hypothetical protein [Sphingomonas sp.]|uniref:hypothetical protein n=1 Tax=Sphingomonas sp. TaxID=28214 RepID=UPI001DE33810|nr:hypothetical protein [Sphingomonas sp.]MBX9796333.1 hypothetical protein [Sphingomonas sp.]
MRAALFFTTMVVVAAPAAAQNRDRQITPYIELGQVLTADLNSGDTLTYTTVAAGIDAQVQTQRVQVQASYRYERRIPYDNRLVDLDVHNALARASVQVAKPLTLEAGALATRTRADIRGQAPALLAGNVSNISQLFAIYTGATATTNLGPVGITGLYRYGYTKVEAPDIRTNLPNQPVLDLFDDSHSHLAQANVNVPPATLIPVIGVNLSGGWARDDARQLAQRYDGKYGRFDVLWPVTRTLALTAGVGYENIQISQRDALRDAVGQPILDGSGRFQTDPNSARRIAYNFDGIYYDAGVIWRPSPRTQLEVHAGERYGTFSAVGSFSWQANKNVAVRVTGYDGIQTFGRQLQGALVNTPAQFTTPANPFGQDFNGCVFGGAGGAAGNCLNGALQSATAAAFRSRGVDAVVSYNRGRWQFGVGAGYANRQFVAPNGGTGFTLSGVEDESVYLQAYVQRQLDSNTTVDASVFANYFKSGIVNAPGVYGFGATGSIQRRFGRLGVVGALGIFNTGQNGLGSATVLQALIGARYNF